MKQPNLSNMMAFYLHPININNLRLLLLLNTVPLAKTSHVSATLTQPAVKLSGENFAHYSRHISKCMR